MGWQEGALHSFADTFVSSLREGGDGVYRVSDTDFVMFDYAGDGKTEYLRFRVDGTTVTLEEQGVHTGSINYLGESIIQLTDTLFVLCSGRSGERDIQAVQVGVSNGFTFGAIETIPAEYGSFLRVAWARYSDTQFARFPSSWDGSDGRYIGARMIAVDPATLTFSYPAHQNVFDTDAYGTYDDPNARYGAAYLGNGYFVLPIALEVSGTWRQDWGIALHWDSGTGTWSVQDDDLHPILFDGGSGTPDGADLRVATRDDGRLQAYLAHMAYDNIDGHKAPYGVVHSYDGTTFDYTGGTGSGTTPDFDLGYNARKWKVARAFGDAFGAIGEHEADSGVGVVRVDPDDANLVIGDSWSYGGYPSTGSVGIVEIDATRTLVTYVDYTNDMRYARVYHFVPDTTLFRWDGTAWQPETATVWDGAAWAAKPMSRWDGAAWVPVHS